MEEQARLESRIVDLELRFMQQEKLLEELSGVLIAQQREIDHLSSEVKTLREQVLAGPEGDGPPKDERPPHY